MLDQIEAILSQITHESYSIKMLDCGTAVITLANSSARESRWIMEAFNTSEFRGRRRPRSFQEIEVKYRFAN